MPTTRAWIEPKDHSVEGHTKQCILTFNGVVKWGPKSCHDNTTQLRDALHKADSRFDMIIMDKEKTVEGHTATISVSAGDHVYLDKLSTHNNMTELCKAVFDAQHENSVCGSRSIYLIPRPQKFSEDKADATLASQLPQPSPPMIVLAPILRFDTFASGDRVTKGVLRRGRIIAKQRAMEFEMEDSICKGLM
ncbi:hypothetical protein F5Y00DRAFT_270198 [Daldinia vernicosa]|uniref:uncharacterized protein n=1 Tax=Daldinia vernicosa TaxID=114800 RepID=UPI0020082B98|nr:uncharacterized protein F5Y00DRAFT_270198 [Daldinia vernicosa]KAI0848464.1 hypothetical protein F5Y00DRAFT_270198 [Daldinia vernicosa]